MDCSPPSRLRREWRGIFVLRGTEVFPIFALTAANLLFEMLCVIPGVASSD